MSIGVDVSKHNGQINWGLVKSNPQKISFAILRCGYRGYASGGSIREDSQFSRSAKECTKYGIPTGVYFFSQAITAEEAKKEAEFAISCYKLTNRGMPIYIDTEQSTAYPNGRADHLGKASRTKVVLAFCERVKKAGYKPGIYASTSWIKNNLDYSQVKTYPLWVADYRGHCGIGQCSMWQYTDRGKVKGIGGNCDMSKLYDAQSKDQSKNPYEKPTKPLNYQNYHYPVITKGDEGVKWLQYQLQRAGVYYDGIDGFYGPGTMNAVRKFQRKAGLEPDGMAYTKTFDAIEKV